MSCCVPQGVWPAAVCGGGPTRHGCQRVYSNDHLPQHGAVGWEPDAAAGQPPQRRHRPAAKVRARGTLCGWVTAALWNLLPLRGRRKHGLMYGLLISDFCFSKVKRNILPPRPPTLTFPSLWSVTGSNEGGTQILPEWNSSLKGCRRCWIVALMGMWLPDSRSWFNSKTQQQSGFLKSSLVAEMFTKPASLISINVSPLVLFFHLNLSSGPGASWETFTHSVAQTQTSLMVEVRIDGVVLYKLPFLSTEREKCNDLTKHRGFPFSPNQLIPVALYSFIHLQSCTCPFVQMKVKLFF